VTKLVQVALTDIFDLCIVIVSLRQPGTEPELGMRIQLVHGDEVSPYVITKLTQVLSAHLTEQLLVGLRHPPLSHISCQMHLRTFNVRFPGQGANGEFLSPRQVIADSTEAGGLAAACQQFKKWVRQKYNLA
jgi:hypothetical protein